MSGPVVLDDDVTVSVVVELVSVPVRPDTIGSSEVRPGDLERHRRELTGYYYRMLGSFFEAEDAVQEAMVRAWRGIDGFEGRSALRSYFLDLTVLGRQEDWEQPTGRAADARGAIPDFSV